MIKFTDAKDGTDVWVSDRAITRIIRQGPDVWVSNRAITRIIRQVPDHCVLSMIDAWVVVLGSAEEVAKKIEDERRLYGN
jgi:uncharacterized protein YlzI (FlbEa/FlbD family)